MCDSELDGYVCTLYDGHLGLHEAWGHRELFAVWDDLGGRKSPYAHVKAGRARGVPSDVEFVLAHSINPSKPPFDIRVRGKSSPLNDPQVNSPAPSDSHPVPPPLHEWREDYAPIHWTKLSERMALRTQSYRLGHQRGWLDAQFLRNPRWAQLGHRDHWLAMGYRAGFAAWEFEEAK